MTTVPDLDGHLNPKGFAGRRLPPMLDTGGGGAGSNASFHSWNGGGAFQRLWFAPGHRGEGKEFTLPGHADLQSFRAHCQTSEEGSNAFDKDKANQPLLGYYSSRDKHASTQPFVPVKNVLDERILLENGIHNLTETLPPYTTCSSHWQDLTNFNHGFGTFDRERGSSSNVEAQCTLNLAQFGSFKVTHPLRVSEEKMHRSESEEVKLDVTLSLSLPSSRKPVNSKPTMGSLALVTSGRPKSTQLTIFYGGNVNVYDNVPVEKAKSIMQWAGGGSECPWNLSSLPPAASCPSSPLPPLLPSPLSSVPCGPSKHEDLAKSNNNPLPKCSGVHKVLPQARKASLARFLEKRKERVGTKTPYARRNIPEQTMSHGDTELSTNCGAICPVMGGSAESDDGKMDHTYREDGNWAH